MNCTSALLAFVPCDVDVGAPIWAGRYMAETAEEISEDDGVDCEDIRRSWRWIVEKSEDGADVWGDIPGW